MEVPENCQVFQCPGKHDDGKDCDVTSLSKLLKPFVGFCNAHASQSSYYREFLIQQYTKHAQNGLVNHDNQELVDRAVQEINHAEAIIAEAFAAEVHNRWVVLTIWLPRLLDCTHKLMRKPSLLQHRGKQRSSGHSHSTAAAIHQVA